MTWRLSALVAGLTLAACGSSAAQGAPAHAPCGPRDGRTLAASAVARVYSVGRDVYGCSKNGKHSFRLGQTTICIGVDRVSPVVVADNLAAYASERCGVDTGSTRVVVRRLSDGKTLASEPATTKALPAESYQSVTSLVLKRDGAAAWIAVGMSIVQQGKEIEVHKLDKHGFSLLDSGPSVAVAPLRLLGSQLSWKHGSSWRSATLS